MKFKRQSREEVSVNLTPLIDIVFLLLIFFMVSMKFKDESHLAISLPEAEGEVAEVKEDIIEVVVDKDGQYSVNGQALISTKLLTLKQAVEKVSLGNHDLPFIITADATTSHQSVVRVMDAASQLGFSQLRITSKQSQ